jgi:hypothetical protein
MTNGLKLNGGGLLPAQNAQKSNSCTACAVTALVQLYVLPGKQWDKNTCVTTMLELIVKSVFELAFGKSTG